MPNDRRAVLKGLGFGLILAEVDGTLLRLSPAAARARAAAYRILTVAEVRTLDAIGDALLPGAAAAGLAHYVDHHLGVAPADSLLMLRYFDWPPPYLPFYRAGLAAIDALALRRGTGVGAVAGELASGAPVGWAGPPAMLVYLALRADAVDVVYGTPAGSERLGLPYMAHIEPPSTW